MVIASTMLTIRSRFRGTVPIRESTHALKLAQERCDARHVDLRCNPETQQSDFAPMTTDSLVISGPENLRRPLKGVWRQPDRAR